MSDGWYETGSRRPRVSEATHSVLSGSIMHRMVERAQRDESFCGCLRIDGILVHTCLRHTEYVIQEEP